MPRVFTNVARFDRFVKSMEVRGKGEARHVGEGEKSVRVLAGIFTSSLI